MPVQAVDVALALAADVLDAPFAAVKVVEGTQVRVLAAHGLPRPAGSSIRLGESLCQYVLSERTPVCVDDLGHDPLRSAHPWVRANHARAYLGTALRPQRGAAAVGALCVLADEPRRWSDRDRQRIAEIAELLGCALPVVAESHDGDVMAVTEQLSEAFIAVGAAGAILAWNGAAEALFGWPAAAVLGKAVEEVLFCPDDRPNVRRFLDQLAARTRDTLPHRPRIWALHRSGRRIAVEVLVAPLPVCDGTVLGAFLLDVTEVCRTEADADRQAGYLTALLDSLDTAVYACDADGLPVLTNQAFREVFDLPTRWSDSDIHDLDRHLRGADGAPLTRAELPSMRALAGDHLRDIEVHVNRTGQCPRTFTANAAPIRTGGHIAGAVVVLHDVTDRRQVERFGACELQVSQALAAAATADDAGRQVLQILTGRLGWQYGELWLLDRHRHPATSRTTLHRG
jgi:PAS domain S-box-containing protein